MKKYIEWAVSTLFGALHQQKYCPLWDKKLNELLDKYADEAELDCYRVKLGSAEVWIANRYYSYGHLWCDLSDWRRPSVKTMIRLSDLQDALETVKTAKEKSEYEEKINTIA